MKKILVHNQESGKRLDKFLMKEVFGNAKISRGEVIREIRNGKIMVNQKISKPSYLLKEGDRIIISNLLRHGGPISNDLVPNEKLKIKIIFENPNFLVIDKPAGIQVHPVKYPPRRIAAAPLFHGINPDAQNNTVANWLVAKYPKIMNVHDKSFGAEIRPGIVHRLDKDTSGLMVIAKNQRTLKTLKILFQSHKVKKTYLAIVTGKLEKQAGVIEKALAKASSYKKQIIANPGTRTKVRGARTEYKVLKVWKDYSLVEAYPRTGRTHQIRIHLWSIGHPIVGDRIYKHKGQEGLAERQLLHAEKLSFKLGGKEYNFRSVIPKDIKDFIKT